MYLELSLFLSGAVLLYRNLQHLIVKGNNTSQKVRGERKKESVVRVKEIKEEDVRKEIRYNGRLYDVTEFIGRHPGGNIIQFYVNNEEDATEAFQQFHHRAAAKVELMLKGFKSRPVEKGPDLPNVPDRYVRMSEDFKYLFLELQKEGYFKGSLTHVGLRILDLVLLASAGLYLVGLGSSWGSVSGTVILGIFFGRCGWFIHEGGHYSLTGWPKVDRFLQAVGMGLGNGMSASWWRSQHNRHHAMPQRLKHDVDLNTAPFFACNSKVFDDPSKANNFFLRNQIYFFAPWGATLVFVNWKVNIHIRYALRKKQYFELFLMGCHYALFEYNMGLWPTVFSYLIGGSKMLLNFALSHSHLPVTEEPRHWLEYSLSHTINIQPSWLCDWWMGYLNYQIEHHLFPTMPQYRQREISWRVRALAEKHHLPYVCMPYREALAKTFRNLREVSKELAM